MKAASHKKSFLTTMALMLMLLALTVVLQSCYPGDDITAADTDLVATFFDKETDFSSKLTYAIRDSVIRLDEDGNPIFNETGLYDQQAINRIKSNLDQAGFTEITNPDTSNPSTRPDVFIIAFANKSTWVSGGCYSSWYSWYYPYYGWCYPVYYSYDTGSLLIVMLDPTEQKNALWVAAINGILEDTSAGILDRIYKNIDQAFEQSQYLNK